MSWLDVGGENSDNDDSGDNEDLVFHASWASTEWRGR